MALAFRALKGLSFEVRFWKGCGLNQCFASTFRIVAKFPWQKSSSISPYFCDRNQTAFLLWCVIAHKTLFSPSFCGENTAAKVPHFHGENPAEFCVWCTMANWQGFMPVYIVCINMFMLGWDETHQSIKHIDACRIHGETNVTSWHGFRQPWLPWTQCSMNMHLQQSSWAHTHTIRLRAPMITRGLLS